MRARSKQKAVSRKRPRKKDAKRGVIVFFCLLLPALLPAGFSDAQQPKKVRIGYLSALNPVSESTRAEGIRLALRERGYIEGQNITIEYRYAEGKPDRLPELAAELVRLEVDIIIAGGPNDGLTAKKATKTIPIVFADSPADPVALGLVDSPARPG